MTQKTAINRFLKRVAKREGKKVETSIGNLRETLNVMNDCLNRKLYPLILAAEERIDKQEESRTESEDKYF